MKHQTILATLSLILLLFPWHAAAQDPAAETAPAETAPAEAAAAEVVEIEGTPLAIFPFQSAPKIDTRVAASMVARLTDTLEATGKFALLDRPEMANLQNEVEYTRKGDLKSDSAARWGTERGIRYILTGTVVSAGKGHGGLGLGGIRVSAKAIALAVEITLIDCADGTVLIESTYKDEKLGLGLAVGSVDFDPESRRGSEMVVAVLQQVYRDVMGATHPPVVAQIDESGEQVTLSHGADLFTVDDQWKLWLPASAEGDADGKPTTLATVQITEVRESESTAMVTDGEAVTGAFARFDKAGKKEE